MLTSLKVVFSAKCLNISTAYTRWDDRQPLQLHSPVQNRPSLESILTKFSSWRCFFKDKLQHTLPPAPTFRQLRSSFPAPISKAILISSKRDTSHRLRLITLITLGKAHKVHSCSGSVQVLLIIYEETHTERVTFRWDSWKVAHSLQKNYFWHCLLSNVHVENAGI